MSLRCATRNRSPWRPLILLLAGLAAGRVGPASAQTLEPPEFPGGFIEKTTSVLARPRLTPLQIGALLPARGDFTFPAPWGTAAVRLTNAADCGGGDCVSYVGYSYWRNINNHAGSDTMLIVVGLTRSRGGAGPTLFSYHKATGETRVVGPLFDAASPASWANAEGWYFSATRPHALYMADGPRLLRYDVVTRQSEVVFDATARFGGGVYLFQIHSSDDDRVHSATLRSSATWEMLGCVAYHEDSGAFAWHPKIGDFDECQVDRSGRWLLIKENVDGAYGEDNRIIDLETGVERRQLDQAGAAGHSDNGHGYMVAADNYFNLPNAVRVFRFGEDPLLAPVVYHNLDWSVSSPNHISHTNALGGVPADRQYACGSSANRINSARANEIVCFRLDTSLDVLVVAPVMTDLDAPGGGDDYGKLPKGNLDVTGRYFIWTANLGGGRLDAFLVKVPAHRLAQPLAGPTVALLDPPPDATVRGPVVLAAAATGDAGIAAVRFSVDGVDLLPEDVAAPWDTTWDSTVAAPGVHTLRATARDLLGRTSTSAPVEVMVEHATAPPDSGPVAHWTFDEGGGTTALDLTGHGYDGTLVGGAARVPGRSGTALAFDGADDAVRVPHRASLNAYPLTVAFWVKTGAAGLHGLVNKYVAASLSGWQVFVNGGSVCAWYFRDALNHLWDGSGCTLAVPGLNDDRWHHVAYVVDASGGRLYVDGTLRASRGWSGSGGPPATAQDLMLAVYPGTAAPFLRGLIDDVRLYDRALPATEVAGLVTSVTSGGARREKPRR